MAVVAVGRAVDNAHQAITAARAIRAAVSADEAVAVETGAGAGYAREVCGGQGRGAGGEGLAMDGEEKVPVDGEEESEKGTGSVVVIVHLLGGGGVIFFFLSFFLFFQYLRPQLWQKALA